jgi:hypothetical protein
MVKCLRNVVADVDIEARAPARLIQASIRKTKVFLADPGGAFYLGQRHKKTRSGNHHTVVIMNPSFLAAATRP